jgi:hypothetical protein
VGSRPRKPALSLHGLHLAHELPLVPALHHAHNLLHLLWILVEEQLVKGRLEKCGAAFRLSWHIMAHFKGRSGVLVFRLDEAAHANLRPPITVKDAISDLPMAGENETPLRYDCRHRNIGEFVRQIRRSIRHSQLRSARSRLLPKIIALKGFRLAFQCGSWKIAPVSSPLPWNPILPKRCF